MHGLIALPVVIPLIAAALLSAAGSLLGRRVVDALAIMTSLAVALICAWVARNAPGAAYWFGDWTPRGRVAPGVGFLAAPLSAGLACFVALLMTAAFVYSTHYFKEVKALFHALMLVFLAAMCGFSLTADLFNLFVWFELMSASAIALCGYKSDEVGPLQGAMNFAVTNTAGAFLSLTGIALLYGRTNALNMAQISASLSGQGADGLVIVAFAFFSVGMLVKGAIVPFHFWLADAHAVAPTPVCVLFSGVMVELALYAIARVYWTIFSLPFAGHEHWLRGVFVGLGALTAVVGALLCWGQRHCKRLLAYSTISHAGLMLIGFGLLERKALAGSGLYLLGHGLIKGALFVASGILLHHFGTVDEQELHGSGLVRRRELGLLRYGYVVAALALSGLWPFGQSTGEALIESAAKSLGYGPVSWLFLFCGAVTGAATLRFGAGVFWGLGSGHPESTYGAKRISQHRETDEQRDVVPWIMKGPFYLMIAAGLVVGLSPWLRDAVFTQVGQLTRPAAQVDAVLYSRTFPSAREVVSLGPEHWLRGLATPLLAVLLAAVSLAPGRGLRAPSAAVRAVLRPLRALHAGKIGDYMAWFALGAAVYGGLLAAGVR